MQITILIIEVAPAHLANIKRMEYDRRTALTDTQTRSDLHPPPDDDDVSEV